MTMVALLGCVPDPVPTGPPKVVALAGTYYGTCGLRSDGTVVCLGSNGAGQLGTAVDSSVARSPVATVVAGISDAVALTGGGGHMCALRKGGKVACWGSNFYGQLGNTDGNLVDGLKHPVPTDVAGLSGVLQVSAGSNHTCVVTAEHTVACFGYNARGQLGTTTNNTNRTPDPDPKANPTPVVVPGLTDVASVSAGTNDTCALKTDGTVLCFGDNRNGKLGNSVNTAGFTPNPTPTVVAGLGPAVSVVAGGQNTCAVLADATLACWGANSYGQLGRKPPTLDPNAPYPTPGLADGLTDVVKVDIGDGHTCALTADGTTYCMGYDGLGQLGYPYGLTGPAGLHAVPTAVAGVTGGVDVLAAGTHSCIMTSAPQVFCFGDNRVGELGTATNSGELSTPNPTPLLVPGL